MAYPINSGLTAPFSHVSAALRLDIEQPVVEIAQNALSLQYIPTPASRDDDLTPPFSHVSAASRYDSELPSTKVALTALILQYVPALKNDSELLIATTSQTS